MEGPHDCMIASASEERKEHGSRSGLHRSTSAALQADWSVGAEVSPCMDCVDSVLRPQLHFKAVLTNSGGL